MPEKELQESLKFEQAEIHPPMLQDESLAKNHCLRGGLRKQGKSAYW